MTMPPPLRKLAFAAHIAVSLAWPGAAAAYLTLALIGLGSEDPQVVRAADIAMAAIGWYVLIPCSVLALVSGLVESFGTEWGLFRHHWVLVKALLTAAATVIQFMTLATAARIAATTSFGSEYAALRGQLAAHAGAGLVVLLALTAVSVYKPWGKIRKQIERDGSIVAAPAWRIYGAIGFLLLVATLHLAAGGGPIGH